MPAFNPDGKPVGWEGAELPTLPFGSPDDLLDATPENPEWVLDGYVGAGMITLLAGPPKRAGGKSTFVWALVRDMLEGRDSFVGRWLTPGPVVYLSEEPAIMLRPKVEALRGRPLRIVWRETTPRPKPAWDASIAQAAEECARTEARLLVVDSLAEWAAMKSDAEKDAGSMQAAMGALAEAAAHGLAIVLVHHHRKGGGEDGLAVRGSTALLAAVDIAIDLTRVPGDEDAASTNRQRILNASSRWPETPESMIVELRADGSGYTLVSAGERYEVKQAAAAARFTSVLPTEGEGMTYDEIAEALGVTRGRVSQEIPALVRAGRVLRKGLGKRGDSYRFLLANRNLEAASTSTPIAASYSPRRGGLAPRGESVSDSSASGFPISEDDEERWKQLAAGSDGTGPVDEPGMAPEHRTAIELLEQRYAVEDAAATDPLATSGAK